MLVFGVDPPRRTVEVMVCPDCERLARIVEELRKKVAELEARLALYEGPHSSSSRKVFPERKPRDDEESSKLGRPPGFEGSTRKTPKPTRTIIQLANECSECGAKLGEPIGFESKVIEEIPEPQPITVTEFKLAQYHCVCCGKTITASHPDCPEEGVFGARALSQVALLKYAGRLPCKLVCTALERDYGLAITPATVLAINSRVTDALQADYARILQRIRFSSVVHVDETGFRVAGVNHWLWVFTTETDTLVVIRQSRGKKVLREVLGNCFQGVIVCDGHKAYSNFTDRIQRCWAHLLREAEYAAEKEAEAIPLHEALRRLFKRLNKALACDPPFQERLRLHANASCVLKYWLEKNWLSSVVKKLVEKIRNGMSHWLTFVLIPGVEPTNNRAERALREHVVVRKIIGSLRTKQGTRSHEVITSVLATWRQQQLDNRAIREKLVQTLRES